MNFILTRALFLLICLTFVNILFQTIKLSPSVKNQRDRHGIAVDGRLKSEDTDLASSTLLADENSRDIFGMVISYTAKVYLLLLKLYLNV